MSGLKRTVSTETTITLKWNTPVLQNQHSILDYELRYSPKVSPQTHRPTDPQTDIVDGSDCDVSADVIIRMATRRVGGSM